MAVSGSNLVFPKTLLGYVLNLKMMKIYLYSRKFYVYFQRLNVLNRGGNFKKDEKSDSRMFDEKSL